LDLADRFDSKTACIRVERPGKVHSVKRVPIAAGVAFGVIATLIPVHAEDRSKENYLNRCAPCHGAEGHGDGPSTRWLRTKPTDLHNCDDMKKLSNDTIFTAIKWGTGALDLPADMPGFFNRLSDPEISSLIFYVRRFCDK
jgi:high-affinity iron transporter